MLIPVQRTDYSLKEYLQLEEIADDRHEYHDGEIFTMTGGSVNHNQIIVNLCMTMGFAAKRQGYRLLMSDVKLWIPQVRRFLYPDVMLIQGQPHYFEDRTDTLTNPILIIEVLSESTQNYDRGDKFKYYRSLSSFKEYILVNQFKTHIEQFFKTTEAQWLWCEYSTPDAILTFNTFDFQIRLSDVYDEVHSK
jgi:Uma2 family endonuclease